MSSAAARVEDIHECPGGGVLSPHGGGPILSPGCPSIKIGGRSAARLGDYAVCNGPTDVIASGAASVLMGALPAARVGDQLVHGGRILPPGEPTVTIGGPVFALPPNFDIDGSSDYQSKVVRDLYLLWTTPSGRELIERLAACGEDVDVQQIDGNEGNWMRGNLTGGVTIYYNADRVRQTQDPSGDWSNRPPAVGLGHEMVHGLGMIEGTHASDHDAEETRTIGTPPYDHDSPTENSIRDDMGLPRRANHGGRPASAPFDDPRPGEVDP